MIKYIAALTITVFVDISKRRIMDQCCIISVYQGAISIINCAQEGSSLITEQGAIKEKMRIRFNIKATRRKWLQSILNTIFEFMLT